MKQNLRCVKDKQNKSTPISITTCYEGFITTTFLVSFGIKGCVPSKKTGEIKTVRFISQYKMKK